MSFNDFLVKVYTKVQRMLSGNRIVFHHIPKCGGTSINRAIRKKYLLSQFSLDANATRRVVEANQDKNELSRFEFELKVQQQRKDILHYSMESYHGFVGGHVYFSKQLYEHFHNNYKFVTVLREPVSRFLSDYYDRLLRNRSMHSVSDDLEQYLSTDDAIVQSRTLTNYLCGEPVSADLLTDRHVQQAVENIALFDVVGFIDDMPQFARALSEASNKTINIGHDRKNLRQNRSYDDIPDHVMAKVKHLCDMDSQVFAKACEHFK